MSNSENQQNNSNGFAAFTHSEAKKENENENTQNSFPGFTFNSPWSKESHKEETRQPSW
jgi:hypothetical protein